MYDKNGGLTKLEAVGNGGTQVIVNELIQWCLTNTNTSYYNQLHSALINNQFQGNTPHTSANHYIKETYKRMKYDVLCQDWSRGVIMSTIEKYGGVIEIETKNNWNEVVNCIIKTLPFSFVM